MFRRSNSRAKSRLRFCRITPLSVKGYKNFYGALCFHGQPKCQNTRRWVEIHHPYVVCGIWGEGFETCSSPIYDIPHTTYHIPFTPLFSVTFPLHARFSNPDPLFSITFPHSSFIFKVTRVSSLLVRATSCRKPRSRQFEPTSNSIRPEVAQAPLSDPAALHSRQQAVGDWGKLG